MATREEILIGYQLINKANIGNQVTWNASQYLQDLNPITGDPLKIKTTEIGSLPQVNDPTIADNKTLILNCCAVTDIEVDKRLLLFLANYPDADAVNAGLAYFNISKLDIEYDGSEVSTHRTSLINVAALIDTKEALEDNGKLLELYKEKVLKQVNPATDLPIDQQHVTVYQDVINSIAFNLRGLESGSGTASDVLKSVDNRKQRVDGRLEVCRRLPKPNTQEVNEMETIAKYTENNISDCITTKDCTALADYIDTHVEQLPLIRRYWQWL